METILIVTVIIFILWLLKKLFTSSDKIWKVAMKQGVKRTDSNGKNCSKCRYGNHTITTVTGKGSINSVHCSKKDIEVTENMICSKFKGLETPQHSLFGS